MIGPSYAGLRGLALVAVMLVALLLPSVAGGADRLYWANFGSPQRISYGAPDGTGTSDLDTTGANTIFPFGLALDPASGRAYWSNKSIAGSISFANLDGSGGGGDLATGDAPVVGAAGVTIDPVQRRAYWTDVTGESIYYARLDGSGGGEFDTGAATVDHPNAMTVDPTTHRLYWANHDADSISFAALDGSGGGDLTITGSATIDSPLGIAIDPVAKRIYWANAKLGGPISYANLDGSGSANLNTIGATVSEPYGVAVDPDAHRVYWANSSGGLGYADTDGKGGVNIPFAGAFAAGAPNFPNLLQTPKPTVAPAVSAGGKPGTTLTCGGDMWAADVPQARLYRAPTAVAYSWTSGGAPVAGATATKLAPRAVGEYRCTATASNLLGSTSQISRTAAIFKLGKPKLNKAKGTAKLKATLPGAGRLKASGKGAKPASKKAGAAKTVTLTIKPKGKAKKALGAKGKAKLKLKFSFSTPDGSLAVQQKSIVLRKR